MCDSCPIKNSINDLILHLNNLIEKYEKIKLENNKLKKKIKKLILNIKK